MPQARRAPNLAQDPDTSSQHVVAPLSVASQQTPLPLWSLLDSTGDTVIVSPCHSTVSSLSDRHSPPLRATQDKSRSGATFMPPMILGAIRSVMLPPQQSASFSEIVFSKG